MQWLRESRHVDKKAGKRLIIFHSPEMKSLTNEILSDGGLAHLSFSLHFVAYIHTWVCFQRLATTTSLKAPSLGTGLMCVSPFMMVDGLLQLTEHTGRVP